MEQSVEQYLTDTAVTQTVYGDSTPIEGLDYTRYTGSQSSFTIRHEITYGDILTSTLLAFLIIIVVIRWFHNLITGGHS
jgi:small-conductance mechanosensitive channel